MDINGVGHQKIYTYASCLPGDMRELSRAGWGIFVAKRETHNIGRALDGLVQTSFRAAIKALLHVVRVAAVPVVVMCDREAVVTTYREIVSNSGRITKPLAEHDRWMQVARRFFNDNVS